MKPTVNAELEIVFAKLRTASDLTAPVAATRIAALAAATTAIDERAAREVERLKDAITEVANARTRHVEAAAAAVEVERLKHASALLVEVFKPGPRSIADLVRSLRVEPSRRDAADLLALWTRFNERAVSEIGNEIAEHVLGVILCDDIVKNGFPTAVGVFASPHFGGIPELTTHTLFNACHAATAHETLQLFIAAETEFVTVARRWARTGMQPTPDQVAVYSLMRLHATKTDLMVARRELEETQGQARLAEQVRTAKPMDTLSMILKRNAARDSGSLAD